MEGLAVKIPSAVVQKIFDILAKRRLFKEIREKWRIARSGAFDDFLLQVGKVFSFAVACKVLSIFCSLLRWYSGNDYTTSTR